MTPRFALYYPPTHNNRALVHSFRSCRFARATLLVLQDNPWLIVTNHVDTSSNSSVNGDHNEVVNAAIVLKPHDTVAFDDWDRNIIDDNCKVGPYSKVGWVFICRFWGKN